MTTGFGFPGGGLTEFQEGWFEVNTEGLANIYLAISDEGIVTASTDDPPSKVYTAALLNPESFSIRRKPMVWPWGDTSIQMAAFGQLQLTNYNDWYSYLVGADLRDTAITIKLPRAMAFGSATLIEDAFVICTAIFDNATCDNEDVITINLKDTLARLDKPLPVRYNPPFVDSGAANRMVPLSLGAVRNFAPLLIDAANRIYQLGDAPMTNVTAVRDRAAPLDPNADPPQYTPALSGSGIQLEVLPVGEANGKLTVDASSVGQQVVIPGVEDVLGGDGTFDSWTGGVPDNWTWSANVGSLIQQLTSPPYPIANMANLVSARTWYPSVSRYGDQLTYASVLQGGKSYRITFNVFSTQSSAPGLTTGLYGGIQVRSALSNLAADAISPHNDPLRVPQFGEVRYVFEFRVPDGADRDLIFIASAAQGITPGTGVGVGGGIIYDVKLQLLGEYVELPLTGITLSQLFPEILINRAGEDASIFDATDLEDLDEATGYELGLHYATQPNITQVLRDAADNYCATLYTDSEGVIRTKRLIDPKDDTPICDFDETNVDRPIRFEPDNATNLTTVIGTTRNQDPFTDADFVTDYDTVPADVRTRYKQVSQYQRTSSVSPAGQYDFARGAPIFNSLIDDPADGQTEIDRVVSIWSPRVYDDGTTTTGKRRFVTFSAQWDDPTAVGVTQQCAVTDIGFGSVVTLNYPRHGFDNTSVEVVGWEIFPFSQRISIVAFY